MKGDVAAKCAVPSNEMPKLLDDSKLGSSETIEVEEKRRELF